MIRHFLQVAVLLGVSALCVGCPRLDLASVDDAPADDRLTLAPDAAPAAPATPRRLLGVQVYTVDVPRGRSDDREFWRQIDEHVIDVGTYDVLWANGLRAGVAPLRQLPGVMARLGVEEAPMERITGRSVGRQVHPLPVERAVGLQTIFWFDRTKRHHGRTFQRSENFISLAFEPVPHRPDECRLTLVPVVRALDARTVVTPAGGEYEVSEVRDQTLFDMDLRVDVPFGWFLVIAPSEDARRTTSLGSTFFTHRRDGQAYDRLYVLVPEQFAVGSRVSRQQ